LNFGLWGILSGVLQMAAIAKLRGGWIQNPNFAFDFFGCKKRAHLKLRDFMEG
jgi:hypothetical protein